MQREPISSHSFLRGAQENAWGGPQGDRQEDLPGLEGGAGVPGEAVRALSHAGVPGGDWLPLETDICTLAFLGWETLIPQVPDLLPGKRLLPLVEKHPLHTEDEKPT